MTLTVEHKPLTGKALAGLALPALKRLKLREAEYREECEQAWRDGYRPHYCIHGTNLWTDYDNICGPCEDGETAYELALRIARDAWHVFEERIAFVHSAPHGLPLELRDQLNVWSFEPLRELREGR